MMRSSIIFFLILLVVSACSNRKEEPAISKVMFINALPGSGETTLLFDGQPLNAIPLAYGTFTSAYRDIRAGKRTVSINLSVNSKPFITGILYMPEFKNYTVYLTKDIDKNSDKDSLYFYEDILNKPASGKANIRFMNLYPDKTAEIDLLVSGRTDTLFKKQSFGKITAFIPIDVSSTYVFKLSNNGKAVSELNWNLSIARENNYTILVTDTLLTRTGERLPNLKLITHQ